MSSNTMNAPEQQQQQQQQQDAVPMLLLEGDEFFVNHNGICRTYYELKQWSGRTVTQSPPLSMEEEYDLKRARKTYTLRRQQPQRHGYNNKSHDDDNAPHNQHHHQQPPTTLLSQHVQGVVNMGLPVSSNSRITVQEIDQGVFGSAGTGATTWESSLAMSLLFSSQPELLQGRVLELGSGVGVGGILMSHVVQGSGSSLVTSLTLTDGNHQVLEECRRNCQQSAASTRFPIHVTQFHWSDPPPSLFDTILASDCAYKYPDVVALAVAMKQSLAPGGTIHIFGPYNRGALQQLLVELQQRQGLVVQVDGLEMNRYRLKSSRDDDAEEECVYASRNVARFLHITATHAAVDSAPARSRHDTIQDID